MEHLNRENPKDRPEQGYGILNVCIVLSIATYCCGVGYAALLPGGG